MPCMLKLVYECLLVRFSYFFLHTHTFSEPGATNNEYCQYCIECRELRMKAGRVWINWLYEDDGSNTKSLLDMNRQWTIILKTNQKKFKWKVCVPESGAASGGGRLWWLGGRGTGATPSPGGGSRGRGGGGAAGGGGGPPIGPPHPGPVCGEGVRNVWLGGGLDALPLGGRGRQAGRGVGGGSFHGSSYEDRT